MLPAKGGVSSDPRRLFRDLTRAVEAFRNLSQQDDRRLKREAAERLREAAERAARYAER
jgi:Sec-independent protein translocase protein TatA